VRANAAVPFQIAPGRKPTGTVMSALTLIADKRGRGWNVG